MKDKTVITTAEEFFADQDLTGVTVSGSLRSHTHTEYVKGQGFIGYGTQIENLKGSNFDDVLTGNNADNIIFGNGGADTISGGAGNDTLDGGKGADTLKGGVGNDIYVVDDAGDLVIENKDEGTDSVRSYISYRLTDNVENLTLLGSDNINATGNELNNTLIGNSGNNILDGGSGNDTLDGGRGNNTLTGGEGNDTFRFSTLLDGSVTTITDYTAGDVIALDSAIFTVLKGLTAVDEHIRYESTTGKLSYDEDGTGNINAIHFATLTQGLDDLLITYQII